MGTCESCQKQFPPDDLVWGEDCDLCRPCLAQLAKEQVTAEVCDACGWAMKFPDEPCANCERFELRAKVERLQLAEMSASKLYIAYSKMEKERNEALAELGKPAPSEAEIDAAIGDAEFEAAIERLGIRPTYRTDCSYCGDSTYDHVCDDKEVPNRAYENVAALRALHARRIAEAEARGAAKVAADPSGLLEAAEEIATVVVQRVAELPDRDSPKGWPEAMLVTGEELHAIVVAIAAERARRGR